MNPPRGARTDPGANAAGRASVRLSPGRDPRVGLPKGGGGGLFAQPISEELPDTTGRGFSTPTDQDSRST